MLEAALDLTQRIYRRLHFRQHGDRHLHAGVARAAPSGAACARTSRTSPSPACAGCGLPARYVSGYLLTYPPPGMEKLQGADASHAWISVWAPEVGWVDFDPTNGVMPTDEHITVAYGRDYDDVSPISGVLLGGSRQNMAVAVDVIAAG